MEIKLCDTGLGKVILDVMPKVQAIYMKIVKLHDVELLNTSVCQMRPSMAS